jgi:MFS family permease
LTSETPPEIKTTAIREVISRKTLPVFSVFFFWAMGTGALWLVRPLFAYQIGGSFLLVALISATSVAPRVIIGPITGFLTDRFGRRNFVIAGATFHIIALTSEFFVQQYWQFLLLEIVAGTGIAMFTTSANVLMADATRTGTRGRAIAARQVSNRVGTLTGPVVAGLIAGTLGLRYVFLFIAFAKFLVIVVALLLIHEHREPRAARAPKEAKSDESSESGVSRPSMFRTRAFATLAIGTVALGLVNGGTGVFRTLFPPQAGLVAGVDEVQIGNLIAIAGVFGLVGSIPAGMATDRIGRKWPLVTGLLATAIATYLMAVVDDFNAALLAVVVFGLAESIGQGTIQVYAMDQAPADRRGAFLGTWMLFTNAGQITGPLVIGTIVDIYGFRTGFTVVVVFLVIAAAIMAIFGRETARTSEPARPDA